MDFKDEQAIVHVIPHDRSQQRASEIPLYDQVGGQVTSPLFHRNTAEVLFFLEALLSGRIGSN